MKRAFILIVLLSSLTTGSTQVKVIEDLNQRINLTANDTLKLVLLDSLSFYYSEPDPDSSLFYAEKEIKLAQELGFRVSEAMALNNKGYAFLNMGNYPRALQSFLTAMNLVDDKKVEQKIVPEKYRVFSWWLTNSGISPEQYRLQIKALIHFNLGILYENVKNPEKEEYHYRKAFQLGELTNNSPLVGTVSVNLSRFFLNRKEQDSALKYINKAGSIAVEYGLKEYTGTILLNMGRTYLAQGDTALALENLRKAVKISRKENYVRGSIASNLLMGEILLKQYNVDSGFHYAYEALREATPLKAPDLFLRSYSSLADLYRLTGNNDSLVKYQGLILQLKDSIFNINQTRQFQNIDFDELQRQQEIEIAKKEYRDRLQKYSLLGGLLAVLIILILLWRNNRNRLRAYLLLREQKKETDFQKLKVEKTLEELKSTQAQLIQSEKMASLGELTAGIAHEIQNPLNFVNNFSAVNKELLEEVHTALENGNGEEAKNLLSTIIDNENKIKSHGDRADAIVKSMMQHSPVHTGKKEPTDINKLCSEYLRLAFHGMKARDEHFKASLKTELDPEIGKVTLVPQDIGKVLLNLYNNAFYALKEKSAEKGDKFQPTVTVITRKKGEMVEITVRDNGRGIPEELREKIFQPFFTTKPTGQGTGLGLSMSYDIIKAHGGEIKVESKEGVGTEFTILLPVV